MKCTPYFDNTGVVIEGPQDVDKIVEQEIDKLVELQRTNFNTWTMNHYTPGEDDHLTIIALKDLKAFLLRRNLLK